MNLFLNDVIRDFIYYYFVSLLEKDVTNYIKVNGGMRNGYSKKILETLYGTFTFKIPRVRNKDFFPSFLTKYKRQDDGVLFFILSSIKQGFITSDIQKQVKAISGREYSTSFIKNIESKNINSYEEFKSKKVKKEYEVVFLDGTYIHINGEKYCIMFIIGVDKNKNKTVLDFDIKRSESKRAYLNMLNSLKYKGLQSVKLFVSDGFCNIDKEVGELFPNSLVGKCFLHFERDLRALERLGIEPSILHPFKKKIKDIVYSQELDYSSSFRSLKKFVKENKELCKLLRIGLDKLKSFIVHKKLCKELWVLARTTNVIEGFNHHFKKRYKYRELFKSYDNLKNFVASFILQNYKS